MKNKMSNSLYIEVKPVIEAINHAITILGSDAGGYDEEYKREELRRLLKNTKDLQEKALEIEAYLLENEWPRWIKEDYFGSTNHNLKNEAGNILCSVLFSVDGEEWQAFDEKENHIGSSAVLSTAMEIAKEHIRRLKDENND